MKNSMKIGAGWALIFLGLAVTALAVILAIHGMRQPEPAFSNVRFILIVGFLAIAGMTGTLAGVKLRRLPESLSPTSPAASASRLLGQALRFLLVGTVCLAMAYFGKVRMSWLLIPCGILSVLLGVCVFLLSLRIPADPPPPDSSGPQ